MDLKQLLQKAKQEQPQVGEKITNRFEPNKVRFEFIKTLNEICLKKSFGKREFEFDDENYKVVELMSQYLNREIEFERNGYSLDKGIWLYGNFGSGKTLIMEAYLEMKRKFGDEVGFQTCNDMNIRFMKVDPFTNKQQRYLGINPFVKREDSVERIFDDLGEEEIVINDYGNKVCIMAYILGERYKNRVNGVITHITTNLDTDEVSEDYGGRIGSRVMEMFNIIKLGCREDSIDYRKE